MRRRDPFGEAVARVRGEVRSGLLRPGAPLIVEDLARDLDLSPTPVREALAHLAGRGVIEGRRAGGRGYAAWAISGAELAGLYQFQDIIAAFALQLAAGSPVWRSPERPDGDLARRAERLFAALAQRAGNGLLLQTQATLSDRLHLARTVEPQVLADVAPELAALEAHPLAGASLAAALGAYSARRLAAAGRIAGQICEDMASRCGNIEEI